MIYSVLIVIIANKSTRLCLAIPIVDMEVTANKYRLREEYFAISFILDAIWHAREAVLEGLQIFYRGAF